MASSALLAIKYRLMQRNSKLDEQFLIYTLEIEKIYKKCNRHEQIRVEQWVTAFLTTICSAGSSVR